jgi:tetratricopeptide (TPR) repeat protein
MTRTVLILALLTAALAVSRADALLDLKKGDPAPPFTLITLTGDTIMLDDLRGREVVLLFGAAGHDKTLDAAKQIAAALRDDAMRERTIAWVTIYSKGSDPAQIGLDAAELQPRPTLVYDADRAAFGEYGVIAMPSAAVIDAKGRIAHVMAGLSPRFGEIVSASLLLAAGSITDEQHDHIVRGIIEQRDELRTRAERHAHLARRLHSRGMHSLAEAEYRLSLDLADLTSARLGLGDLLIRLGRLDEAEEQFRAVLNAHPKSLEATIGFAHVYVLRGGDELHRAEELALKVIERSPNRPRAHFVLGLVHEERGDAQTAAGSYRKAAELLLDRAGPEDDERE